MDYKLLENQKLEDITSEMLRINSLEVKSEEELSTFIYEDSRLSKWMSELSSKKYIEMLKDLSNDTTGESFEECMDMLDQTKHLDFKYKRKVIEFKEKNEIESRLIRKYVDRIKQEIKFSSLENVELESVESKLVNLYTNKINSIRIDYDNKKLSINQAMRYLATRDEEVRKTIWTKIMSAIGENLSYFNKVFVRLMKVRNKISFNSNCDSYYEYMNFYNNNLLEKDDFNKIYGEFVESEVVPYLRDKTKAYKPTWAVPEAKNIISKPYKNIAELLDKSELILSCIDDEFKDILKDLRSKNNLDLDVRKNKGKGTFCVPFQHTKSAYIYMNIKPSINGFMSFFHELGHAINFYNLKDVKIYANQNSSPIIGEMIAMTFELICLEHIGILVENEEECKMVKKDYIKSSIKNLVWISIISRFEFWNYENTEAEIQERLNEFSKIYDSCNYSKDWTGFEREKTLLWIRQQHIFEMPFYYINYAKAQLGAYSMLKMYREDKKKFIDNFKKLIKMRFLDSRQEMLAEFNIDYNFGYSYMKDIFSYIKEEI